MKQQREVTREQNNALWKTLEVTKTLWVSSVFVGMGPLIIGLGSIYYQEKQHKMEKERLEFEKRLKLRKNNRFKKCTRLVCTMRGNEIVTPTQLLLNYMNAVEGKAQNSRLLISIYKIVDSLDNHKIQTNIFFRGCIQRRDVYSETLSSELWYWRSNGFIQEDSNSLSYTKKGKEYFMLKKNFDDKINWNLSNKTKEILKKTIREIILKQARNESNLKNETACASPSEE